ncbi:HAD-IA family hydrolase [Bremerella sp. JC817]|uniref:HAD-IA family hydrolase n=1 Tax=Bremerella sp. JC817 TaxID=3231756 RepID=UPI00345B0CA8
MILLDAVGTIIFPSPSVASAYQAAGRLAGINLDETTIRHRFREAIRRYSVQSFQTERGQSEPARTNETTERLRWQAIVQHVLSPPADRFEEVFDCLWNHFGQPENWQPFDDVSPALAILQSAGFQLGIASNFDSRLRPIVERYLGSFDLQLFISSEVGWVKPAPAFYQTVQSQVGIPVDQLFLIGDDLENDVVAPKREGWQAAYLSRKQEASAARPSGEFASLLEFAKAISQA